MKPIGTYNRLPKTFKQPERLKPGQSVTYRLHEDFKTIQITSRDGKKEERWPESLKLPVTDVVYLKYKDEKDGEEREELFDIGIVRSVDRDNVPTVESWWLPAHALKGEFVLTGGDMNDEKRYWFAELSNYNGSNPNRDKSKKIYFYKVDVEGEAEDKNKLVDLELECLLFIKNCTPKELKKLAAAFQYNENLPMNVLRDKLNSFARKDPKKFSNLATSKDVEIKATIQRAYQAQVIKYNPQQHKIMWSSNNSTIASLKRVEGLTWQEQFTDWIKTAGKGGTDTFENIKKLLNSDPE
jgi:hypothetical protein